MISDYQIGEVIQECYKNPGFAKSGVEGLVKTINGEQVLAIRGSTDTEDWLTNLKFLPLPHVKLRWVHAGFWWGAKRALKTVVKRLDKGKPLYIGGHSKGGPEAVLLAWLLKNKGYDVRSVTTFGAPEFISPNGASKAFKALAITQYRNGGDIVPLLPVGWLDWLGHARPLMQLGNRRAPLGWEDYHPFDLYMEKLKNA